MTEAHTMMQEMLAQQRLEFRELLAQELVTIRGRSPVINEPVVIEGVNNGPIPTHTIQEGNNDDSESY